MLASTATGSTRTTGTAPRVDGDARADDRLALALRHHRAGNLRKASEIYRKILRKQPRHPDALHLLGLATDALGRPRRAVQLVTRAIAADPDNAAYRHSLGVLLRAVGRPDEAVTSFRAALEIDPGAAETLTALGNALKALGRYDEAVGCHRAAVKARPGFAEALSNLGSTLREAGRIDAAVESLREAVALRPDHPDLHFNLGNAWLAAGRLEEAEQAFGRAVAIAPRHARSLSNLGVTLREQGRPVEAMARFRAAIAIAPEYADAHWNLGLALLMEGDFEAGWREYEWRRRIPDFAMRRLRAPAWDGGPLGGRTLLVHAEQGLGDAVQFARYLGLAAAAGGPVVFACPPALGRLFSALGGCECVVSHDDDLPRFDVQAPLMSLPGLLDPDLRAAAALAPYLRPEPDLVEAWRARLGRGPGLRIGICWQGNPGYHADRRRSIPMAQFAALARLEGVRLFSLQKGPGADQLAALAGEAGSGPAPIEDLGPALDEGGDAFVDTAAVLASLDLVIASDTALPHLAGALGRDVWLLLAANPDWRWGRAGEETPWYPSMRLFRQRRPGDWEGVFERVAGALGQRMARGQPTR